MSTLAQQAAVSKDALRATIQRRLYDFYYSITVKYQNPDDFIKAYSEGSPDLIKVLAKFMLAASKSTSYYGNNPLDDTNTLLALEELIKLFITPVTHGEEPPKAEDEVSQQEEQAQSENQGSESNGDGPKYVPKDVY